MRQKKKKVQKTFDKKTSMKREKKEKREKKGKKIEKKLYKIKKRW